MNHFSILSILVLFPALQGCIPGKSAEIPWQGIERSMRYHPEGEDFVIHNGKRRFNRAIYGTNTGFRIEAGDLPEFALYLPGMGGNLKFGIGTADSSIWLIDAAQITARYRPGSMLYEVRDPLMGTGTLDLHVLAHPEGEGMILKMKTVDMPGQMNLYWAYGGASGKRFPRSGDIGADPESSFYLKPEYCTDNTFAVDGNSFSLHFGQGGQINGTVPPQSRIRVSDAGRQESPPALFNADKVDAAVLCGKMPIDESGDAYFSFSLPSPSTEPVAYEDLPELFERAEEARKMIAGRIRVKTPDPYLNNFGAALAVAADAIWEPPSYLHGAVAWRMRLPGWRGAYAGDWLGWHERARMHFNGYAEAQYTSPESGPAIPDPETNLARQVEKAGNSLFTSGYISRYPGRINRPHHYDMNLVFIDQLLWHYLWTGDLDHAREMWPVIERHLAWEKRCFDPDEDGLYNAYCCIWASDALQYSGGGVTHSSAYNYRGNLLAAGLAELIGKDPEPYRAEAEKIRRAVQQNLWLPDRGWYAEYRDALGLRLVHPSAAVWTIYHAIDAGLPDAFQAHQSLRYIDEKIPHIPIRAEGLPRGEFHTLSTSNWMPYTWSINNVALAENLHTCLAFWQAGRSQEAFRLWKGQFLESMYLGASPGNFQQLSFYDAFRGELYRDFADPVGMAARTLVEGLFGIVPNALEKTLLVRPGLPDEWNFASLKTPDIYFDFVREGNRDRYLIVQELPVKMDLLLRLKARRSMVDRVLINGRESEWRNMDAPVGDPVIEIGCGYADTLEIVIRWTGDPPEKPEAANVIAYGDRMDVRLGKARLMEIHDPQHAILDRDPAGTRNTENNLGTGDVREPGDTEFGEHSFGFFVRGKPGHKTVFAKVRQGDLRWWMPVDFEVKVPIEFIPSENLKNNELRFRIRNHSNRTIAGMVRINGSSYSIVKIPPNGLTRELAVAPGNLRTGSNLAEFVTPDSAYRQILVNWDISSGENTSWEMIDLSKYFNDRVSNIFRNKYLSPRVSAPTLQIPVQGIGDWCSYARMPDIDDSGLRRRAGPDNRILLGQGIPLRTPGQADVPNILFTSRWDNYPDSASIPLDGKASHAYLLMAGSAHHMQSRMTNGRIIILYVDGSSEILELVHPDTWWPIEQDYYIDGYAFRVDAPKPPRIYLKTGAIQQEDYEVRTRNGTIDIPGGAASLFDLPLDPSKELRKLRLETVANDLVIGLMSVTLIRGE